MTYRTNSAVHNVQAPPIAQVFEWLGQLPQGQQIEVLDVSQAVPSYPSAQRLTDFLAEAVKAPDTSRYTDILGLPVLRAALARHMSEDYAVTVDASQVAITAGCNQAFCVVMNALAVAGDEVILIVPYYFNHLMWLQAQGIRPVYCEVSADAAGNPDVARAATLITERTRAIVLVSPNNPTGCEYSSDLLSAFFELAAGEGVALVVDETYKDFRSVSGPPHTLFQRPNWAQTFIQLYSFSKVFSLTGYRVGSIIAGARLLREIEKVLDCVAICPPRIGQLAAEFGLQALDDWKADRVADIHARMDLVRETFAAASSGFTLWASGAYFGYIQHPFGGHSAEQVARHLLESAGILCLPGSMFGPGQEAYLRFAFANLERESIPALVARLGRIEPF